MNRNHGLRNKVSADRKRGLQSLLSMSAAACLIVFIFISPCPAYGDDAFSPRFNMPKFEDYARTITDGSVSAASGDMIYTYNCASLPLPGGETFDLDWICHSKSGARFFNWQKFIYKETWMENGYWMPEARIYFHDGSGSRSEFIVPWAGTPVEGGIGTYSSDIVYADGSEYTLQIFTDGAGNTLYMVIADKHGNKMYFEPGVDYKNTSSPYDMWQSTPKSLMKWEKGYLKLTSAADRNGNGIGFSYRVGEGTVWTSFGAYKKPFDLLQSISLPGGRGISFGYDEKSNVTSVSAPDGNNMTFKYEPAIKYASLPVSITDAMGRVTSFKNFYRLAPGFGGVITSITNPRGKTTYYEYRHFTGDEDKKALRCYKITDPAGNHEHYNYDVYNYLTTYTDKAGFETEYTYHMDGLILQERRPDYSVIFSKYDMLKFDRNTGMGASPTPNYWFPSDFNESGDAPSRDPWNSKATNVGSTVDRGYGAPYDIPEDITRDHYNSTATIDGNKKMTKYQYDLLDNMLWMEYPEARYAGASSQAIHHVDYEYHPAFNFETKRTQTVGGAWVEERRIYGGSGNLMEWYDPQIIKTSYGYSPPGNMTSKTVYSAGADGDIDRTTLYGYDGNGSSISITDPQGKVTSFVRDSYGRILTKTDPRGYVTAYTYDKAGHLLLVTHPDGTTQRAFYDNNGNMITYKDQNDNWTTYAYDDVDALREIHNPDGGIIYAEYDADGRKKKQTDAEGHSMLYSFSYDGKLLQETDAYNHATRYGYDFNGNNTCVIDASNNQAVYFYDGRNKKIEEVDSVGNETTYENDEAGNVRYKSVSVTVDGTKKNLVTEYRYDRNNRLLEEIDPMRHSTKYTYDSAGNKLSAEDANGKITRYAYDGASRLKTVTDHLGKVTAYSYDENGNLASIKDANGHTTGFEYDVMNRKISETDALGKTTTFKYDGNGNLNEKKDANGNTIKYEYDNMNLLRKVTYPDDSDVSYTYDKAGNKLTMDDSRGTTSYEYDDVNRLTKVTSPGGHTIEYTYNKVGSRKSKLEDGRLTKYEYDKLNRLTKIICPDEGIIDYTYDEMGRRLTATCTNNTSTDYTYNDSSWLTLQVNHPAGGDSSYSYTYDNAGNRLTMTDNEGLHDYDYDDNYRLTKVTYPDTKWTEYGYDNVGNRKWKKDITGTTNYTYDNANRMLSSGNETFEYDDNGNLMKKIAPEGETLYTYDYDNRLTEVHLPGGSGSGGTITKQLTQGWNFIALPDAGALPGALNGFSFGIDYDHLLRLNNATHKSEYFVNSAIFNDFNSLEAWWGYEIYVNKPSGKLLSYDASNFPGSFNVQLKAGWQLIGFPVSQDTLVSALGIDCIQILEYNKSSGTLQPATTVKPLTAYFIECAADTMVSYTNPPSGGFGSSGETVSFAYDGDGKRISKTSGGTPTQYIWDLDNISTEVVGSLKKSYVHGPKVDEIVRRSDYVTGSPRSDYYYHADGLGSVSQITDYAGAKLVDYSYDVFGEIRKQTGSENGNTYLFCGRLWDGEIELYYNRARYYAPEHGRFISKDTHGYDGYNPAGVHRYLYANANPVRYIDPLGEFPVEIEEVQPGDIAMQRTRTNAVSNIPRLAGESYAHTAIILEVKKNDKGRVMGFRIGDLRAKPENQRLLDEKRGWYFRKGRKHDRMGLWGEKMSDYDYFRVTNDTSEAQRAVERAEHPEQWDVTMDPETMATGLFRKKDISKPDDKKMICPEYINFLYENKFKDPEEGVTRPSDIDKYQKKIKRSR